MRLIKSQKEIEILKKAIDITCNAHIEVMKMAKAGMYEYELEAQLEYVFRKNSSQRLGFPSIVGSGKFLHSSLR
jgi:Xaa-Pro aminopeptidase